MLRLDDTVVRLRATTTTDPYGNTIEDWTTPTETTYPASVQPDTGRELVVDQDRATQRWRAYLPAFADIQVTDRLRWDADDYDVDADPELWRARGRDHHLEVRLVRHRNV